ncbi:DUF1194 domain-containing protein [Alphaproteobacteria bacterium GH1-50]|uniref:DUF1194 domain-containing protein n=1 Tax=Kangsaoukella pontilimi TaxID=2691042 RepID=A0A7C9IHQ1_9RHOB|nr:DUF1194 domain-containing protein [Kangsaoukella pontilimi]
MVIRLTAIALSLALALPAPASACRLALLLAVDVSSSVDANEDRLQRNGLASALISPEVQTAFFSDPRPVALAAFEWSGRWRQTTILPWREIRGPADLVAAAEEVAASTRSETRFPTALGYALGHAASLLEEAPVCDRQVIDVSGDGRNNEGFKPELAYRNFPLDGVTVNALAIGGSVTLDEMVDYYRNEVIRGPGAFVEEAQDYADFERAMRRKLEREVAAMVVGSRR